MKQTQLLLLSVFLLTESIGCRRTVAGIARETTPVVVGSGLESASEPENREKLRTLLDETPVSAKVAGINGEVVDTVLARLADPKNEPHLRQLIRNFATSISRELASPAPREVQRQKDSVIANTARLTVRAAVDELRESLPGLLRDVASDPAVQDAIRPLSRSAAGGAMKGAADTITGRDGGE